VKCGNMAMTKPLIFNAGREGQGVAKTGYLELENQQGCELFEGSNPSLSAKKLKAPYKGLFYF